MQPWRSFYLSENNMMPIVWNGYLVALSVLISIFGSFAALSHMQSMRENSGKHGFIWVSAGAATLALAIWSMHFIGMLAFHLPIQLTFDVKLTVLSILPALFTTLFAFHLLQNKRVRFGKIVVAGVIMGLGVAAMHYTGMAALKMQPAIIYDTTIFVLSIVVGIVAASGALFIIFAGEKTGLSPLKQQFSGAVVMGLAIAGMHYTGMAGANFAIGSICSVNSKSVDPTLLAFIVTSVVLVLFSAGALANVIDRRNALDRLRAANVTLEENGMQLRSVQEKLSGILEAIPTVVWSMSASHELIYMNPAGERIYGRSIADFSADPHLWQSIIHVDDRARVQHWLEQIVTTETLNLEYRIVHPDGTVRWLEDRARTVRDERAAVIRIDGVAADVSERRRRDEHIKYLANYDMLTGLPNRNLLMNRLEQSLLQANRSHTKVALLFLDIDRFKYINDSFGHLYGDALLVEFAARLKLVLREVDTVARFGGDEFIIVLADIKEIGYADLVALKIINAFARPISVDGRDLHVTTSIGVSLYPDHGNDAETLLKNADVAMYKAKDRGRNGFQSYTSDMGTKALARMTLIHALRQALDKDEFELYYQPQIEFRSGRVNSMEALIRWHHPQLGFVPPSSFIELAEETGLIVPIGAWVMKTACMQASAWHLAGHRLSIAVNVSGQQFQQRNMLQLVRESLAMAGLEARYLELELTESLLMNDSDPIIDTLKELKTTGISLSIDDFGTGFSSLSYLSRFPIDVIKIDQSFIANLSGKMESASSVSITRAIIALAKAMGLKTIAEGVETQGQLDFLQQNGCDAMQGYYFSRPLPADQIDLLLEQGTRIHRGRICDPVGLASDTEKRHPAPGMPGTPGNSGPDSL
jgi:diguanylate cyclase (GGDEF)-like protein/PAS domain S-box-containing protein